ncbi:MAG TPA: Arc family DNA-binding protein [Methylorubrum populi]|uniref:Arc family DNA-binding protein n=1 Tax=Methylorubrum populi TaxID=223967 RepID=A0A921JFQ0_9HYPH|nr:Arc family DNA-binding protein [Methylorubrum populi]
MSKPPAPSDLADKFMLRMPEGMRDRLKAEAEANNRSMNSEIVARLQQTFDRGRPDINFQKEVEKILSRVAAEVAIKTASRTLGAVIDMEYSSRDLTDMEKVEKLVRKITGKEDIREDDPEFAGMRFNADAQKS